MHCGAKGKSSTVWWGWRSCLAVHLLTKVNVYHQRVMWRIGIRVHVWTLVQRSESADTEQMQGILPPGVPMRSSSSSTEASTSRQSSLSPGTSAPVNGQWYSHLYVVHEFNRSSCCSSRVCCGVCLLFQFLLFTVCTVYCVNCSKLQSACQISLHFTLVMWILCFDVCYANYMHVSYICVWLFDWWFVMENGLCKLIPKYGMYRNWEIALVG